MRNYFSLSLDIKFNFPQDLMNFVTDQLTLLSFETRKQPHGANELADGSYAT